MPRPRRLTPDVVRARLSVLADRLHKRDEDADFAEAVDAILAPRGWELLKRPDKRANTDPNMALWMNTSIKQALEERARAEAKKEAEKSGGKPRAAATVLAAVVNQGFERFLAGDFVPSKPVRSVRGSSVEKSNLNIGPSKDLRGRVEQKCAQVSAELGWEVTPGRVAMSWLYEEYGITDDDQRGVTVPEMPDHAD
ncbi:hypothetical protein [Streptomyces sp. AS02]|uniref:hypothetical protein n=1 Tax=Streptomyces sp. AS02 TaxID=2938946 RepID=UPI0020210A36|nr:hypothetical protein [Streptomyces sp. AS02]MCL8016948.1 hypothetical protein [Streptomyces sp. AS02]